LVSPRRIVFGPITAVLLSQLQSASPYGLPQVLKPDLEAGIDKQMLIGVVFDPNERPFPSDWKAAAPTHVRALLNHLLVVALPLVIPSTVALPTWSPDPTPTTDSSTITTTHVDVTPHVIVAGHAVQGSLFPAMQQHRVDAASVEAREQLEWAAQVYIEQLLEQAHALTTQHPTSQGDDHPTRICALSADTIDLVCTTFHPVKRNQEQNTVRICEVQQLIAPHINGQPIPPIPSVMLQQPTAFPRPPLESLYD